MDKLSLEEFIYQVKHELLEAQKKHEGEHAYFELQRVEFEVSVAVNRAGSGKVNIYVAELGADVAKELTHVVKLAFDIIPYPDSEDSGSSSANSEKDKAKTGKISKRGGARKVRRGTKGYK
jgi:aspartate-semialdehyde dehydrogenase